MTESVTHMLTPQGSSGQINHGPVSVADWEVEGVCLLRELHDLLETYAPSWYMDHLHDRAERFLTNR